MKLKIISIHNHGNYEKEYAYLKAVDDCDVGDFVLADTTYLTSGKVSNKLRHMFWFPDKEIEAGDAVTVWTQPGVNTTIRRDDGTKLHRFYWGLKTAVWNDAGDGAVLLYAPEWQCFRVLATVY